MSQNSTGSAESQDDFAADVKFGEWLREQRNRMGLTLEECAKRAALSVERLKCLELGLSERGITSSEGSRLASVYQVSLAELSGLAAKA